MTRRLYLRIYLAFVGIVLAFLVLSSLLWWRGPGGPNEREFLRGAAAVAQAALPPADASRDEVQDWLARHAGPLRASMAVFSVDGGKLAAVGDALPPPDVARGDSPVVRRMRRSALALRLDDGRWLVASSRGARRAGHAFLGSLVLLAGLIAAGAYPLARGVTRRLENLERGVESLAAGDLAARVEVEGRDEIARLAGRVNHAAARIEGLVGSQRTLLASASHELRSPLARIRVAAELLGENGDTALRDRLARDIAELDAGIEELLVASRLGMLDAAEREEIDLLGLVAEEAARAGVEASGEPVGVYGDRRSLRHLVRNLLRNASTHAPGSPVEVWVGRNARGDAVLRVSDRGPGVPEGERETIFEPFARGAGASPEAGVGLGLALVAEIARHHDGDARHQAREGGGSTFEVVLPRAEVGGSTDS